MSNTKETIVMPPLHRCENCRYWQENEPTEIGGRTGECVRHAPVFARFDEDGVPEFVQPTTGVYATCGEWGEIVERAAGKRVAEGPFRWIY